MDNTLIEHLCAGNRRYLAGQAAGDVSEAIRRETAEKKYISFMRPARADGIRPYVGANHFLQL